MYAPLARTDQEAEIYIEMTPCHRCGGHGFTGDSTVIHLGDDLGTRWTGTCTQCGAAREFVFRLPQDVTLASTGPYDFGADGPSELLDPGQWMTVADLASRRAPAPTRDDLLLAVAAFAEVARFIPDGAAEVPADAFRTDEGRAAHRQWPSRFTRQWLQDAADALRRDASGSAEG